MLNKVQRLYMNYKLSFAFTFNDLWDMDGYFCITLMYN